ncbi:MAG: DUF5686 and carboxypeptidase regulatory-like domain-containing protein [Flavobacteriales bacterium]|nr:DUF5686 and carboxypeptidase regulatory-like domain-containing protein [Flavobacteriales bacterium]
MTRKALILLVTVLSIGTGHDAFAQRTRILGSVANAVTGRPLPFANVSFSSSSLGTVTDSLGNFVLETNRRFDSLRVSSIGYRTEVVPVVHGVTEEIDFLLQPLFYELSEVIVLPGENPAFRILRKVIANKPINTPERLDAYEYGVYHRVRFDLNNFTEKAKKNFILRPFDYIWDHADTTEAGVAYLPILMTETSREVFYRKDPQARMEVIRGRRDYKFFRAPRIMEFVQDMYIDPNIYDNHVVILDKSFPSPINDFYRRNYRFVLMDSLVQVDGRSCYHIAFRPKGKSDVAFTGGMFIDDSTFAVVQVDVEFSIEANINFVRNYWIRQNYSLVEGKQWFLTRSQVLGDFTVVENSKEMTGFFGRKTTELRDIRMNRPREDGFYSTLDPVVEQDSAYTRTDGFWEMERPDTLSQKEQELIGMVERLNSDPKWKRTEAIIRLVAEGYLELGPIDLGNVFTFYSWNTVEGHRAKLGFRTNRRFSETVQLSGHAAYGFGDQRWKGGGTIDFFFPEKLNRRMEFGASYRNDLMQQGRGEGQLPLDHVLTSFVRISGAFKRMMAEQTEAHAERQWFTGFSTRVGMFRERYSPLERDFSVMAADGSTVPAAHFTASGLRVGLRFGWGQKLLPAAYNAVDSGLFAQRLPVVAFEVAAGFRGLYGGQFDYQHLRLKVQHRQRANKLGYLQILAEGGIINGTVPFPLLHAPAANPLVFNDDRSFNLMNYMEFAADRYVSLQVEHHFEGFFFNRIPGVRLLKLREFVFAKAFYGTLTDQNANGPFVLADGIDPMTHPYVEVGFGIENILKIARIDFTWRLTHLDRPNVLPFVVKPSFYFRF